MSEITPNTPNPVREDAYKQQLAAKLGIDPQYIPGSPIWHSEEEIAAIAEMFSNMAGGSSGGGVLVVNIVNAETGELDKTWKEISDAGFSVLKNIDGAETSFAAISTIGYDAGDNLYYVTYGDVSFAANSQTDYPVGANPRT